MRKSTILIVIAIVSLSVIGLVKASNMAKSYMDAPQTDAELIEILKSGGDVDFIQ